MSDTLEVWQLVEGDLVVIKGNECEILADPDSGTEDTMMVKWFNHETNMVETEPLVWDLALDTWGY